MKFDETTLYIVASDSDEDEIEININTLGNIAAQIPADFLNRKGIFLLAFDYTVMVSDSVRTLLGNVNMFNSDVYHLYEFNTYQDALDVALDMMETHEKCYNTKTLNNG